MSRVTLLFFFLPLALAACGSRSVQPPESYDLSGTVGGAWGENPRLRLALVGTGLPGVVTNDSNQSQNVVAAGPNVWKFGFDLPNIPAVAGVYQVVVFDDANNDAAFTVGEKFARNKQWLIYSPATTTLSAVQVPEFLPGNGGELLPGMHVGQGWNLYNRSLPLGGGNPGPVDRVMGYDLSR